MSTPQLVEDHRRDLGYLIGLASSDLLAIWEQQFTNPVDTVTGLMDVLPELVDMYGAAATSLGGDWYEEVRAEAQVPGRFPAIPAPLPDKTSTDLLARWGSRLLFTKDVPDVPAAQKDVLGGLQRFIANADRETVMGSAVADPKAHGWKRATTGTGCSFCRMVAGRNIIFSSAAGKFACHNHCMCIATPAWGGEAQKVDVYVPTTDHISDADRARVRQWLKDNPDA